MKRLSTLILALTLVLPVSAREVVITILHTNDLHGRVLSTAYDTVTGPGGLARIVTMARNIRAKVPNTILLDAGDAVQGTPTEFITQGESMIAAMNASGFDAATLGNHEFDWTQAATEANVRKAKFPFLSANALDKATGKPFGGAKESVILARDSVRIGVFGLTTTETPEIEWPNALSRIRFDAPTPAAKRIVAELRTKVDVIVCLSHLGYEEDQALAKAVPGIDIIIGGHSHTALNKRVCVGRCVIAQTGSTGANLGRMDIRFDGGTGHWKIVSVNGVGGRWWPAPWPQTALLPLPETVERDRAIVTGYRKAWNETQSLLAEVLGVAQTSIPAQDSKDHRELTLLLADLLRQAIRADVAIMPPDYGPAIPAGPFTEGDLYRLVSGFTRQNVVTVRATGEALRKAVERAFAATGKPTVQFAGVGGWIVYRNGIAEWRDANVNGRALDEAATYRVASGAYPIMDFPSLMDSPLLSDRHGWLKPLLASAIRERVTLGPVSAALKMEAAPRSSP